MFCRTINDVREGLVQCNTPQKSKFVIPTAWYLRVFWSYCLRRTHQIVNVLREKWFYTIARNAFIMIVKAISFKIYILLESV